MRSGSSFPGLSALASLSGVLLRLHPIDMGSSLKRVSGFQHPVLEFSGLEGANLIDFHLRILSLPYTSQSPDSRGLSGQ